MKESLPEDTAARLLECARDLYLAEGPSGFSMRRIAGAAGVSATAIYRHYRDKEALMFAVAAEGFRLFKEALSEGQRADDPMGRLFATNAGYLRFAVEHTDYYRVIFMSDPRVYQRFLSEARPRMAPTFELLVDRVRECQAHGYLREGDPSELALHIWAHCHGLVSLWICGLMQGLEDTEVFSAFYTSSVMGFVSGLGAPI